jgi:hypothetical protein
VEYLGVVAFTVARIRGMSILCFSNQDVAEIYIVDDQDKSKHVGTFTSCVQKIILTLVHLLFYVMNFILMHGNK